MTRVFGIAGIRLVCVGARCLPRRDFGDVVVHASKVKEFRRTSFDVEHGPSVRGALTVDGGETHVWTRRNASDPSVVPIGTNTGRGHRATCHRAFSNNDSA